MDVILHGILVNYVLAVIYGATTIAVGFLIHYLSITKASQWSLVSSKKTYLLIFLGLVMATTFTVTYQNLFNDNREAILWWRVGLISSVCLVCIRWTLSIKRILRMTDHAV